MYAIRSYYETIQDALDATGISPELLEVELTESLALKDIDHVITSYSIHYTKLYDKDTRANFNMDG